jgi:hypothetical protein
MSNVLHCTYDGPCKTLYVCTYDESKAVEELYGTQYRSGSFSFINVGSGFHCLRSFFFFYSKRIGIYNLALSTCS